MSAWDILLEEAPRFFTYWNMLFLLGAAGTTLGLAVAGCGAGFALGFLVAIARLPQVNPLPPLRWPLTLLVEAIRRIPFLVLLLCVFFAFQASRSAAPLFLIAAVAVGLRMAALTAENARAGFEAIHRTQWEAALTMNFSGPRALATVILPQAWRVILPPATVHLLSMVKETALAVQIGLVELTSAARALNQRGFSALLCYGAILVIYFVISFTIGQAARLAERRLTTRRPAAARFQAA